MRRITKHLRRVVISVAGAVLILIGVAMLVLPGPGLAVIALGLFVLSWEFEWADRHFQRLKHELDKYWEKVKRYFRKVFK